MSLAEWLDGACDCGEKEGVRDDDERGMLRLLVEFFRTFAQDAI